MRLINANIHRCVLHCNRKIADVLTEIILLQDLQDLQQSGRLERKYQITTMTFVDITEGTFIIKIEKELFERLVSQYT